MAKKVGIFPGTFDPLHDGHIGFCLEVIQNCGLDIVYFLPEPQPRNKPHASQTADRLQLIQQLIKGNDKMGVMTLPVNTFTISSTLPKIFRQFKESEITYLMGSDNARGLSEWQNVDELLKQTHLAVGLRGSDTQLEIETALQRLYAECKVTKNYTFIQSPHPHLSSTYIRKQAFA